MALPTSPHSSQSSSRQSISVTPVSYRSLTALSTQSRDWVSIREKELCAELCEERRNRGKLEGALRKCRKDNQRVRDELRRIQSQQYLQKAAFTNPQSSEGDYLIHCLEHVASVLERSPDLRVLYHGRVSNTEELLVAVSSGRLHYALLKVVQVLSDFVAMYADPPARAVEDGRKPADFCSPAEVLPTDRAIRAETHTALLETMTQQRRLLSVLSRQLQCTSQRLWTAVQTQEKSPRSVRKRG